MKRILIADDDAQILRALRILLTARGYEVLTARTGAEALSVAVDHHPDLVMLDLGMPQLDGIEVIEGLRGWTSVPILVVSGRTGSADKVDALDAGADDYVPKPFSMDELLARLRAATRHAAPAETSTVVETAAFTVDLPHRQVVRDGSPVRLTPTEWHMLELLALNVGKVVGRQQLLTELRGPNLDRQTHYLRVHMAALRRKVEADPARPRWIATEPGVGYRLRDDH